MTFGESGDIRFARLFPKLITFEPPPCTWFMRKIQKPMRSTNGRSVMRSAHHADEPVPFESNLTLLRLEQVLELRSADCGVG